MLFVTLLNIMVAIVILILKIIFIMIFIIIFILKIMNPMYAVCNITNASQSTRLLASTTLRSRFQVRTKIFSKLS